MGRVIYLIVTFRLEEEVASLPADHRHQPANERGGRRVFKDEAIRG